MTDPKPAFEVDDLEVDGAAEPLHFTVKGEPFTAEDVAEHDWQDLLTLDPNDPEQGLRIVLGDEQYERMAAIRGISMRKLGAALEKITAHFGLGDPGEGNASSGS